MEEVAGVKSMCGDGEVEYPCVRRFRHRRLITYLWLQGFKATHRSMLSETDAVFSVRRMQEFVLEGQWSDAYSYLCRFLPFNATFRVPFSVGAQVLHRFVAIHKTLHNAVAGREEGDSAGAEFKHYVDHSRSVPYCTFRLRSIILNVVNSRQFIRTSLDWERVRIKASTIISDLVYQTPELNDLVFVPRCTLRPLDVLPIGFGFRRRSPRNKQARRPPASAVAKIYLGKKKISLPPSSSHSQESVDARLTRLRAIDLVADILDENLKAGIRPELPRTHPVQTTGQEGIPVAQVAEITKLTSRAENRECVQQDFNPRKNRREASCSDKQDVHPKRQRSAEDSGEASLMLGAGGLAKELVNHSCVLLDDVFFV
ncbi:hypothetical protein EJB05_23247 [Eragrostis curvula]|uniref:Uncharacterized protein n=1 Tax=Eragrostis curvula TaxID=38414 RepID=A0A5J9V7K9_9POAL|nr:hypothetical protein EJB05_23247 [Eragrostis curvula]